MSRSLFIGFLLLSAFFYVSAGSGNTGNRFDRSVGHVSGQERWSGLRGDHSAIESANNPVTGKRGAPGRLVVAYVDNRSTVLGGQDRTGLVVGRSARRTAPDRFVARRVPRQAVVRQKLIRDIKGELYRLGCYHGKINTVWDRAVQQELADLYLGLVTDRPDRSTLTFLRGRNSIGCSGNGSTNIVAGGAKVQEPDALPAPDGDMVPGHFTDGVQERSRKKMARKRIAYNRGRKTRKSRRRARRKKSSLQGMFAVGTMH